MSDPRGSGGPGPRPARSDAGLGAYVSVLHGTWLDREPERRWTTIDGTLVFADVSGFTPLAERLARHGKVGAEELTETLNTVFADFLDVAAHFGGDCLKFGGDALLLLFTDHGHERRAAATAHGMSAALRSLRRQRTSAGLAKLGISMGASSGPIQVFLVGDSHRELMVAGPVVSRTLELEATATAGQILIDDRIAAALDLEDVDELEGGWLDLRRAPTAAIHELGAVPPGAAERGISDGLREHLRGRRDDGEHRIASVGFLHFSGTDDLLAADGPDALAGAFDLLVGAVQQACDEHGANFLATDVDRNGGKFILAAGMPVAAADDEDSLLLTMRAALDGAASSSLSVNAGANRGRIFAVDLGGRSRRTFTVMGDAVNLAARVMGKAGPGELVATPDLLERRKTDFELETLEPFMVKGKSAPIEASLVGRSKGRRAIGSDDPARLVGREEEVALIHDLFDGARTRSSGGIVELVGDAGIGKSKLVRTLTEEDHGLRELVFEAGRYSLATPYFALRRGLRSAMGLSVETPPDEVEAALRAIVDESAPRLRPWIPLLGVPLGLELADTPASADLDPVNRQATLHVMVTALMAEVLSSPTLITIEDSHWLDEASSDLLRSLLTGVEHRPWAVLVTRRAVAGGLDLTDLPASTRRIEPLTRDDLVALARVAAGDAVLAPGVMDEIVDRSGGNPLFLQELLSATIAGNLTELPETIEAVVAASIDTLSGADRALLRQAAVLGGHLSPTILAQMMSRPLEEVEHHLERMTHFLTPIRDGSLRFRHILLRDVAYEGLSYRSRRSMHERAGRLLEAGSATPDDLAELLSIHFHRAGRYAESWHYSRLAGERSQRAGAPTEAASFYTRALEAAGRLGAIPDIARSRVAEALGDVWELGGRYEEASNAYQHARKLVDLPLERANLCHKVGLVREHEGRYSQALSWFTRGLRTLEAAEESDRVLGLRAELATAKVHCRIAQGRHAGIGPQIEGAIADASAAGAQRALARALVVYDQLLVDRGRYAEARHSERAVEIYEDLGDHRGAAGALNEMGSTAYWLGSWDEAVRCWERAIEADQRAGALVNHGLYINNIGEVRSDQGRWDEAEALLQSAFELFESGGWRICAGWTVSNLGRVAARDGRLDLAEERFVEARSILSDISAESMVLETDVREMERLVLGGEHASAVGWADELRDRAENLRMFGVADLVSRVESYALCQSGDPAAGLRLARQSVDANRGRGAQYEVALGLEAVIVAAQLLGIDATSEEAELNSTFSALGVVRTPKVPLPD